MNDANRTREASAIYGAIDEVADELRKLRWLLLAQILTQRRSGADADIEDFVENVIAEQVAELAIDIASKKG